MIIIIIILLINLLTLHTLLLEIKLNILVNLAKI